MATTTSKHRSDRDGILLRDGEGVDSHQRLHTSSALRRFTNWLTEHGEAEGGPNPWDQGEATAKHFTEHEDSRLFPRAMAGLLAHWKLDREHKYPMVAMRNVREGDYVQLHGITFVVKEVVDEAENRGPERNITIRVAMPSGRDAPDTYKSWAYEAHVRIPLIARPVPTDGGLR